LSLFHSLSLCHLPYAATIPVFLFSLAFFLSIVPPCISFYPSFTLSFFSLSLSFSWPESLHHTFIYRPQSLPSLNLTFFLFCHPSPIISLSLSLSLSLSSSPSSSLTLPYSNIYTLTLSLFLSLSLSLTIVILSF